MTIKHLLKPRKCPQCESIAYKVLSEKDGFEFAKCSKCALIYVPNILIENAHISKELVTKPNVDYRINSPKVARIKTVFKFLNKYSNNKDKVSILDFGCGNGLYLKFAKQLGYKNIYAVDINSQAVENARSIGAKSFCGNLKDWNLPDEGIDLIVMDNVIEHFENTKETLSECSRILKNKGIIFISTPNIDSFIIKMLGTAHRHFGGAEHLTYFTIPTLCAICATAGFKPASIKTALEELTITRMLNIVLKRNLLDYDFDSSEYKEKQSNAPAPSKSSKGNKIFINIFKFFMIPFDFILINMTNMFKQGAYIDSFFIKDTQK
ncbi:MAG: class I SAM-dependent methyltransferase [Candidatus Omnitrophica bacterium]|nr:class I SAM-dependent methyltransferase [Candidatus Omnitrophota bacterium]